MRRPPDEKGVQPAGNGCAPFDFIALGSNDESDTTLDFPISQLRSRPIGPGELSALRVLWWRHASAGHRMPAEIDVILIEGGAS